MMNELDFLKTSGLFLAIIQQAQSGEILMNDGQNEKTRKLTLASDFQFFFSRREKLSFGIAAEFEIAFIN